MTSNKQSPYRFKLKESSTLVINEKSKELINQGKKVYQFGFGQSPFPVPEKIVETLKQNAHRKEYLPKKLINLLNCEFDRMGLFKT